MTMILLQSDNICDHTTAQYQVIQPNLSIGSGSGNDLVLNSAFIPDESLTLRIDASNRVFLRSIAPIDAWKLNDVNLIRGREYEWLPDATLSIYPYRIKWQAVEQVAADGEDMELLTHLHVRSLHGEMLKHVAMNGHSGKPKDPAEQAHFESTIDNHSIAIGQQSAFYPAILTHLAGESVRDLIAAQLSKPVAEQFLDWRHDNRCRQFATAIEGCEAKLEALAAECARVLFENETQNSETRSLALNRKFAKLWQTIVKRLGEQFVSYLGRRRIKKLLMDHMYGFGLLDDLINDPIINEIMVVGGRDIYVEKHGSLQLSNRKFLSHDELIQVIKRLVESSGRHIDFRESMVDARLPNGSRVNAVLQPLAVAGPSLTIRKFPIRSFTMQTLYDKGTLPKQAGEFLSAAVKNGCSILVSGGTSTGKTTMLNVLTQAMERHLRIICIEDTHELSLMHEHVDYFECRRSNSEGVGEVTMFDLVRNALRQRPDRLIIGETRGSQEAMALLEALNTGHFGSLTTIHANSAADALQRLASLVRNCGLTPETVRQQISNAFDLVVQMERLPQQNRFIVSEIAEVVRVNELSQNIELRTIFQAVSENDPHSKQLVSTGCLPTFIEQLISKGFLDLSTLLNDSI